MTMFTKILAGGVGLAAMAAAAPATAQYTYPYSYSPYGNAYGYQYGNQPYGNAYGYYSNAAEQMAAQRCAAEVETRLQRGTNVGGVLTSILGMRTAPAGRVLSIHNVKSTNVSMRVRGIADSGRMAYNYGPYGYGAYGAVGHNYATAGDLSFKCDVDYRGRIRDVDIVRRR
jgi:hypothetical protein